MSKDIFLSKKNTLNLFKKVIHKNSLNDLKKEKKASYR